MTKKEIVRKGSLLISFVWLFYITIKFLMGKADTFSTICMFVLYSFWALKLILSIVVKITEKVKEYIRYESLVNAFEYLQAIHKERYKLYFTGDREIVEKYTDEIEFYGNALLEIKALLSLYYPKILLNKCFIKFGCLSLTVELLLFTGFSPISQIVSLIHLPSSDVSI